MVYSILYCRVADPDPVGSGSGWILNVFLGSGIIIPDPDQTNIKTNLKKCFFNNVYY